VIIVSGIGIRVSVVSVGWRMNIMVVDSMTIRLDFIRCESWMLRKFEIGSRFEVMRFINLFVVCWRVICGLIVIRCV